jgi:hypothetical protein
MKKTLLAGAMALTLGTVATTVSAYEIAVTSMDFNTVSVAAGTIDKLSMGDTFSGTFFNAPWTATTQSFFDVGTGANIYTGTSAQGNYTYNFTLTGTQLAFGTFFTWSVTNDIPVLAIMDCGSATPNAGDSCAGTGTPMQVGPFPGQSPAFSGIVAYDSAPSFTSATTANTAENNAGTVYTAAASAGTADTPTYSITGGADETLFNIDGNSGVLSFKSAPDFETPTDAGANNIYDVEITATWSSVGYTTAVYFVGGAVAGTIAGTSVAQTVAISVTNIDEVPPVISLLGTTPLIINVPSYTDDGATALDDIDGAITGNIVTVNGIPNTVIVGGPYSVTYNVDDAAGNSAVEVVRTVTVVDNTDPVVTRIGDATVFVILNGTYTEQGATVADDFTSGLTATIGGDTVDTSVATSYTITYSATDASGNTGQVSRTVSIVTNNPPLISVMPNNNVININEGDIYIDGGAIAFDSEDGVITNNIVTVNNVPTPTTPGTFTVTYNVTDSGGLPASQKSRTINIADITAPEITLNGNASIDVVEGIAYTESGATVTDNFDSGLTVTIGGDTVNTSTVAAYVVTYNVSDAAGNAATQVTRTVNVIANNIPVITLLGDATTNINEGDTYSDLGATASDNEDGNLTGSIVTVNNVNASTTGTYTVTYNVTDSSNFSAVQVTRTVNVNDASAPVITLEGNSTVEIMEGASYTELGATVTDNVDNNLTVVVAGDTVDTSTVGTYIVTYNVTDTSGNAAVEATRTVNVLGTPKIFINGAAIININEGSSYTDLGARATDVEDGNNLTVTTTGTVDTAKAASYDIVYSVTDSHGNTGSETRRVIVRGEAGQVIGVESLVITEGAFRMKIETGGVPSEWVPFEMGPIGPFTMGEFQGQRPTGESKSVIEPVSMLTFPFFDKTVGVFTGPWDGACVKGVIAATAPIEDCPEESRLNNNMSVPTATVDTISSTIEVNMPSWIAFWTTTGFAQGATVMGDKGFQISSELQVDPVLGEVLFPDVTIVDNDRRGEKATVKGSFNPANNTFSVSWDAVIVGGAFDNVDGHWRMNGTVNLVAFDPVPPVITLNGNSQIAHAIGSTYTDAGVASITDNVDGTIAAESLTTSGSVNTSVAGTYTITYSVPDSSGNIAVATREVVVFDGTMPVITLNGNATQNLSFNIPYVEEGATATDDLTVGIGGDTVDHTAVGTYFVTYNAVDASGNPAFQVTRTITVIDVDTPVITPTGVNPVHLLLNATYTDEGATAEDAVDDNTALTNIIVTDNPVDTSIEGVYTVTYTVTDKEGNIGTATRTVYVDNTGPVITIIGNGSIALPVGGTFTDEGATASDGDVSGTRVVTTDCSAVSTAIEAATAGRFVCTYTATDAAGNVTVVERVITILDVIVPTEPVLLLTATQNSTITNVIVKADGSVVITTNIPTVPGTTNTFDWSATDNVLVPADAATDTPSFSFDPAEIAAGTYEVVVTTNTGTEKEVTSRKLLTIVVSVPTLTDTDSDGDGVVDSAEGFGDDDNDGIPNHLDDSRLAVNEASVDGAVMRSSTGTLRLGSIAFAAADVATGDFSSQVNPTDIVEHGGSAGGLAPANANDTGVEGSCVGGCFDFDVTNMEPGSSVDIVIPLSTPLGDNMSYRKYTTAGGWVDFNTAGDDAIASSGMINGACPAPNAVNRWIDGIFAGDTCIRLTIQDGGPNDADGLANGVVTDPSGAAVLAAPAEIKTGFADGCSATDRPVNPWDRSEWLLIALFITLLGMRRKLFVRR